MTEIPFHPRAEGARNEDQEPSRGDLMGTCMFPVVTGGRVRICGQPVYAKSLLVPQLVLCGELVNGERHDKENARMAFLLATHAAAKDFGLAIAAAAAVLDATQSSFDLLRVGLTEPELQDEAGTDIAHHLAESARSLRAAAATYDAYSGSQTGGTHQQIRTWLRELA